MRDFIHWSLSEENINSWNDVQFGARPICDLCHPRSDIPPKKCVFFLARACLDEDMLYTINFRFGVSTDFLDDIRATPIEVCAEDVMR